MLFCVGVAREARNMIPFLKWCSFLPYFDDNLIRHFAESQKQETSDVMPDVKL